MPLVSLLGRAERWVVQDQQINIAVLIRQERRSEQVRRRGLRQSTGYGRLDFLSNLSKNIYLVSPAK